MGITGNDKADSAARKTFTITNTLGSLNTNVPHTNLKDIMLITVLQYLMYSVCSKEGFLQEDYGNRFP